MPSVLCDSLATVLSPWRILDEAYPHVRALGPVFCPFILCLSSSMKGRDPEGEKVHFVRSGQGGGGQATA